MSFSILLLSKLYIADTRYSRVIAGRCETPAYRRLRAERRGERLTANAPTRRPAQRARRPAPGPTPHRLWARPAPSRPSVTLVGTVCLAALFEVSVPGEGLLTHSRHSLTMPLLKSHNVAADAAETAGGQREKRAEQLRVRQLPNKVERLREERADRQEPLRWQKR